MNFWHMQLHPGEFKKWSIEDIYKILQQNIIGCSGSPVDEFKQLKRGDVVLIRHGGAVLALVRLTEKPRYIMKSEQSEHIWFDCGANVEVLETYQDKNVSGSGWFIPTTLMSVDNDTAYKYIQELYSESINKRIIMDIKILLEYKHQIILQGPPGTGKTRLAKILAEELCQGGGEYKLVQFHPSYSYEDFVRGISVKANGSQIEYNSENRILGEFAQKALDNYLDCTRNSTDAAGQLIYKHLFDQFKDFVQDEIDNKGKFYINETAYIFYIESDSFRYKGDNWPHQTGIKMKFTDLIYIMSQKIDSRSSLRQLTNISGLAFQHATYYFKVIQKINEYIAINNLPEPDPPTNVSLRKYVLIIDEINRANLSAVLGELIYALEYRNEPVASMYELDGNRNITLPTNMYIIGTMNTADRSVGHIDYAIRRRFAFVDVLPSLAIVQEHGCSEAVELFRKTLELFCEDSGGESSEGYSRSVYLSPEFRPQDVMLGHSYFIEKDPIKLKIKLEHEIKPILNEYLKDGVLLENAKSKIEEL